MKCDKCGSELNGNESFCTKCGNPVLEKAKVLEENRMIEESKIIEEQKNKEEEEKILIEKEIQSRIYETKKRERKDKITAISLKIMLVLLVLGAGIVIGIIANKVLNEDVKNNTDEISKEEVIPSTSKFVNCNLKGDFYNLDIKYEFDNDEFIAYEVSLYIDKENYEENIGKIDPIVATYLSTIEYDFSAYKDEAGVTYQNKVDKNKNNHTFKIVKKDVTNDDLKRYYFDRYDYKDMEDFKVVVIGTDCDMLGMICQ